MNEDYKKYVVPKLHKDFIKMCKINSTDFYGSGIVTTAHLIMEDLMSHIPDIDDKHSLVEKKCSIKEAWENGMEQMPIHSGMSAAITATIIAKYSPRGEEFKKWCIKNNVVDVKWI
jgi:hypothetical protein